MRLTNLLTIVPPIMPIRSFELVIRPNGVEQRIVYGALAELMIEAERLDRAGDQYNIVRVGI